MNVEVDVHELSEDVLHAFHVVSHAKTWRGRNSEDFSGEKRIITKV